MSILLLIYWVVGLNRSPAQEKPLPSSWEVGRLGKDGNPLPPYLRLTSLESRFMKSPQRDLYLQWKATLESFMGEQEEAIKTFDLYENRSNSGKSAKLSGFTPTDARQEISRLARRHRVIMIGEAHHEPQTRLLTIELLKPLWKEGFRYLALEDVRTTPRRLVKNGYPTPQNGYYVNEPVFGELVRQALKCGYRIVMYDDNTEIPWPTGDLGKRVNFREEAEAEHLKTRIFDHDPKAKVLIHVGYGHDSKEPTTMGSFAIRLMANRLKTITGINPFCMDGYTMRAHSAADREAPGYARLGNVKTISLLKTRRGRYFTTVPGIDADVILPRPKFQGGRPGWLETDLHRRPYPIAVSDLHGNGPWLVEARYANEKDDAIPVDRILVRMKSNVHPLMLPAGNFRIRVFDPVEGWSNSNSTIVGR